MLDLAGPADRAWLNLQQGFVHLSLPAGNSRITFRLGWQEMLFGAHRLVSLRKPVNIRLSFDGVRTIYEGGGINVGAFPTGPVKNQFGSFGDTSDPGEAFWGIYATSAIPASPGLHVDAYYLGFKHDHASFGSGVADEHRHTLGTRLFGEAAAIDDNTALTWQTGSFGSRTIAA